MTETTAPGAADQEPATQDGLKIWSCVHCRRRKLRCERREPCSNCVRSKMECHFPVTGRLPRRSRDAATPKSPAQQQAELMGRLRRLEAVVTELTGQMEDGAGEADGGTPNVWRSLLQQRNAELATDRQSHGSALERQSDPGYEASNSMESPEHDASATWQKHNDPTEDFGNLVTESNGSLRVAKGFWSIFCTEVDNIFQAVADVTAAAEEEPVEVPDDASYVAGSLRSHHQGFVLGNNPFTNTHVEEDLSPLPSQMLFIWQVFCENVDPFIKILDTDAIGKAVQAIKGKLHTMDPETEALMFSISLAAILSLDEDEVDLNFGVSKPRLLARFRLGIEKALASAEFMTTSSVAVTQAFVIYVTILPQLGASKLAAPMTSILVRTALSMGLHRDPAARTKNRDSTAFAHAEVRRRLWWHVCFLDSRVRRNDVPELSISQITGTTKEPASVDDIAADGRIFTSVTLCIIRCELWRLSHTLRDAAKDGIDTQQELLSDARTRICEAYFAREEAFYPKLQEFTYHLVLLFFSQVEYTICRRQILLAQRVDQGDAIAKALECAATLMDTTIVLKSRAEWKCWRWQLQGQVPWSAMLFTSQVLRQRPCSRTQSSQAWTSLQTITDGLGQDAQKMPIFQLVKKHMEEIRTLNRQPDPKHRDKSETHPSQHRHGNNDAFISDQTSLPSGGSCSLVDSARASSFGDGRSAVIPGSLTYDTASTFLSAHDSTSDPPLDISWETCDFGADLMFNWDPLMEVDDAMDWQLWDADSFLSFSDLNSF